MKKEIYFITGNEGKASYLAKLLGVSVERKNIDLDEVQSMDLKEIVSKKMRTAYDIVQAPVLVEDVALEFMGLGGLPGPFIKFFLEKMSLQELCDLVADKNRKAIGRCMFGYYDGEQEMFFEGSLSGEVAKAPKGDKGFGWDKIFLPDGFNGRTRAELTDQEYDEVYLQIRKLGDLKQFLIQKGF